MEYLVFIKTVVVLFLWLVVNLTNIKSMPHEDFLIGHNDIGLKKGHLVCHCGLPEKIIEKDLDIKIAHKMLWEVVHDKDFLEKIRSFEEVKQFVDSCTRCNLTYINCSEELCIKKAAKFSLQRNVSQTEATETSEILRMSNTTGIKNNEIVGLAATTRNPEHKYNVSNMGITLNVDETKNDSNQTLQIVTNTPVNVSNLNEIKDHVNNSQTTGENPTDSAPQIVDIPIGGHKNHSRQQRHIGCSHPSAMETAAISCRVYPSSIKCVQRCAFGYTLESGIQKEMQCKFKENRWVPSGFKECLPFVDCSVTLSSGGSATCTTASADKAPICKIECLHYEDKPSVPMALYKCKVDGSWEPPLPFCAIAGSGMVLATPPRVKQHKDGN